MENSNVDEGSGENRTKMFLLINCLNLMGASMEFIRRRVECFTSMEKMFKVAKLGKGSFDGYFLGSQIEGCTLAGLHSDEDIMMVWKDIKLVTDLQDVNLLHQSDNHEEAQGAIFLKPEAADSLSRHSLSVNFIFGLVSDENSPPGYAKIIGLEKESGVHMTPDTDNSLKHLCEVDSDGSVLFSSDKLLDRIADSTSSRYRHGPAMTEDTTREFKSSDLVYGLYCPTWPKSAQEWITRKRNHRWPNDQIIDLARKGCFLVPVSSDKSSSTEWRFSFTLLERELIWTWSGIQYKTFLIMKIIKKEFLEKKFPNVITSYHLKTVMFWMSEERSESFWSTNNYQICIHECLIKLAEFIQEENCPHYFIKRNNLLRNKLNTENKMQILTAISNFCNNLWNSIFQLPILQEISQKMECMEKECFQDIHTACFRNLSLMNEMLNLRFSAIMSFATSVAKPMFQLLSDSEMEVEKSIANHKEYKTILSRLYTNDTSDKELTEAIQSLVNISMGSQLLSKSCQQENDTERQTLLKEAEDLIRGGISLDTSMGKLKLATLHFISNNFENASILVKDVLRKENTIPLSGFEPQNPDEISTDFSFRMLTKESSLSLFRNFGALEVVFLPSEFPAVLDPIKFEIFRALNASRYLDKDNPLRWVTLDAKFYALLMQFFIKTAQGLIAERTNVLTRLRKYVKTPGIHVIRKVVALNIVGYCLMVIGDLQWATDVFMGSLILQNTHNSAALHLALLAWKQFAIGQEFSIPKL